MVWNIMMINEQVILLVWLKIQAVARKILLLVSVVVMADENDVVIMKQLVL
jgi:hypothetical protein